MRKRLLISRAMLLLLRELLLRVATSQQGYGWME